MEKKQFVNDLQNKDDVASPFLVKYMAVMEGKDGKSYLNVILADATGEIEARKWQGAEKIASQMKAGDYVYIQGKINAFQSRLQLIIQEMNRLELSDVKADDYIKKSNSAPDKMFQELIQIVEQLEEVYIKELLLSILHDGDISRRLKVWQAGKSIHHAYQSGLLEHILSCTKLGMHLSSHYQVNRSYVVAGCILHDLCKIYELTDGPVVDYTEEGKLIGHLVKGLEIVDHFASRMKYFPYQQKTHLKHILLAHHGEYEYGSPKIPHTSEAFLVHLIDLMDSKMSAMDSVKKQDTNTGHWSGMIKHLDRVVYKPELPSFTKYIEQPNEELNSTVTSGKSEKPKKQHDTEIKQNLGSLLKNIKIED